MSSKRSPRLWSRPIWALLILITALVPTLPVLADSPVSAGGLELLDGAWSGPDRALTLAADAGPPPSVVGGYQRYGSALSLPVPLTPPVTRLKLSYAATLPPGAEARVDVRASPDGQRWLPWVIALPDGAVVGFDQPVRLAQYRVILLGGPDAAPVVRDVRLASTGQAPSVSAAASPAPFSIAPTFRIRATRQGMVGGRTANGYIIPPRARFVALPSWTALSTRGRDEYQVRITYQGRSAVAPVYDVGPHSERDDYWNQPRRGFPQLERGWPLDHAAYYEGFNGGRADKGFVRFPTAMDVGDGVWWDDLGIVGDQAEVEVTFLWLGQDPLAGPPQRDPAAPEHIVDELGADFWHSEPVLNASPVGCGMARHAYHATTVNDPARGGLAVRWQPNLPVEAEYDLFVHVPVCPSRRERVTQARYIIQHRDGAVEVTVNQRAQTGWVHLGRFPFKAGVEGYVQSGALAGDAGATIWFDQARWVRAP